MANEVEPEILVNSVLGKISDVLMNGDDNVIPKSDDHFLAFMSPGIPMLNEDFNYAIEGMGGVYRRNADIDAPEGSVGPQDDPSAPSSEQLIAQDALAKYMQAESFFNLVDLVPDTSGIIDAGRINTWNPESRISSVYAMALQQSQVFNNQPDEATKKEVDRLRAFLKKTVKTQAIPSGAEIEETQDSDLVVKYFEKMTEYLAAALEYNNARISALAGTDQEAVHSMGINGSLLQLKVSAAKKAWSGSGFKGEYESITAAIQAVEERAFVLLKQRYKEDYARSILTNPSSGSNFLYCAPASTSFARGDAGWSKFIFNSGSFASNHKFKSNSTTGGGGFAFGSFFGAGKGSVTKKRWENKIDTEKFEIEFELARVPISRPWLNLDFLLSGFWRFDQNNVAVKNSMISDGNKPPLGLLPVITTDLVMLRGLKLDFGSANKVFEKMSNEVGGSGGIAFGPIHIGGRHANASDERSFRANWSSQGVRVEGLQLLGYICYMLLQKCPDPNPGITKWM
ncbi:MAG: hypothetical protein DWQ07_25850 [Chloroflexi bacterium]|nr:MAG: hypothetical protein DWQ07_25850 [Chloroflexota bacterium]